MSLTKFLEMYLKDIKLFLDFSKIAEGYIDIRIFNDLVNRYYKRLKLKRINEVYKESMYCNYNTIKNDNKKFAILKELIHKKCFECYELSNKYIGCMKCKVVLFEILHKDLIISIWNREVKII